MHIFHVTIGNYQPSVFDMLQYLIVFVAVQVGHG